MLENFDPNLAISPERMPYAQLQIMFSTLVFAQTIHLEMCEAISLIDKSRKFDDVLAHYETMAKRIAEELKIKSLAKFGE